MLKAWYYKPKEVPIIGYYLQVDNIMPQIDSKLLEPFQTKLANVLAIQSGYALLCRQSLAKLRYSLLHEGSDYWSAAMAALWIKMLVKMLQFSNIQLEISDKNNIGE